MQSKWGIISRLVKEKRSKKKEEVLQQEIEKARKRAAVGTPFKVEHVSHVVFNAASNTISISGLPKEWEDALSLSKQNLIDDRRKSMSLRNVNGILQQNVNTPTVNKSVNLTWNPMTGEFENLPSEWQPLIDLLREDNADHDLLTTKKRLLNDQLAKSEFAEREKRKSSRFSIPPMEASTLSALLGPPVPKPPDLPSPSSPSRSASAYSNELNQNYFVGAGSILYLN